MPQSLQTPPQGRTWRVTQGSWAPGPRSRYLVLHVVLLRLVQVDLDEPAAVQLHADPLAHDLTGEHQVLQDGVVHGREGAAGEHGDKRETPQREACPGRR